MADAFTPPPISSWQGPAQSSGAFTPPPVSSWQGPSNNSQQTSGQQQGQQTQQPSGQQHPDILEQALNYKSDVHPGLNLPLGILQGAIKGGIGTVNTLGDALGKVPGLKQLNQGYWSLMGRQAPNQQQEEQQTTPIGVGQGTGKFLEQAAELAVPAGLVGDATKGAGLLARLGAQAATGAGISAIQSKGDPVQTILGGVAGGASELAAPAVNALGKVLSNTLGLSTGAGKATIERAFNNPDSSELIKGLRGKASGGYDINDIVNNIQKSVSDFSDNAKLEYQNKLNSLVKSGNVPNWNGQAIANNVKTSLNNEIGNFAGQILPNGDLDLSHVAVEDRPKIQSLYDEVSKWGNNPRDLTPEGLDNLKKNIIGPNSISGGKFGALATRVNNVLKDGLETSIPGYEDMTKNYAQAQDLLRNLKSEMSVHANGQGNPGLIARKLSTLMKQTSDYKQSLIDKLPNGNDLMDQIAGFGLSPLAPKGLAGVGGGMAFMSTLTHPALWPAAIATASAASPRIVGEGSRLAGKAAQSTVAPILGNIAKRGIQSGVSQLANPSTQNSGGIIQKDDTNIPNSNRI